MSQSVSLIGWLRAKVAADALLASWRSSTGTSGVADYEADALGVGALAARSGRSLIVAIPGGRARLPLLAAVHAAVLQLPGYPSPFTGRRRGPSALVTRQVVRRDELAALDAAGIPVLPAVRAARLRADARVAPLPAGQARDQHASDLLLLVHPSACWRIPTQPPSVVVIDGADESAAYVEEALAWAAECGAPSIVFADVARRQWPAGIPVHPCGWSVIAAYTGGDHDSAIHRLAVVRGHASVLGAGSQPELAGVARLLAEANRRGPLPAALVDAAIVWRRLNELVVPVSIYDAACPRWHSPTLTERLEDLQGSRSADFPTEWRTWAESTWASVKGNLLHAAESLAESNPKATLLVETVDANLRMANKVDIGLSSRVARDAAVRHLSLAGVSLPADGRLTIRSLSDEQLWAPPQATLLTSPPSRVLRHRMVGADIGTLNVLCYDHEVRTLAHALTTALDEPELSHSLLDSLTPPALDAIIDWPNTRLTIRLSRGASQAAAASSQRRTSLRRIADTVDQAGMSALNADPIESELDELPDEREPAADARAHKIRTADQVSAVPIIVTVEGLEDAPTLTVNLPADSTVARLLNGAVRRIAALDVTPGMLLTGLDGPTLFDRLRPMLVEARGPVTSLLLTAWDQALDMALRNTGGATALTRALRAVGAGITTAAVAEWSLAERIGPREPENVRRVGELANHPVVAGSAAAIAEVMASLRVLHQAVGRIVASMSEMTSATVDELEQLLGLDVASLVIDSVTWRVVAVSEVTSVAPGELLHVVPAKEGTHELAVQSQRTADPRPKETT